MGLVLLQGDMCSFNMAPTELLTGLYITRSTAPKLVSEHTGHAVDDVCIRTTAAAAVAL